MSVDNPLNPAQPQPMIAPGPEPSTPDIAPGQPSEPIITDVPIPPGAPAPQTPPSPPEQSSPGFMSGQVGEERAAPRRTLTPQPPLPSAAGLDRPPGSRGGDTSATIFSKVPPSPAGGRRAGDEGAIPRAVTTILLGEPVGYRAKQQISDD